MTASCVGAPVRLCAYPLTRKTGTGCAFPFIGIGSLPAVNHQPEFAATA